MKKLILGTLCAILFSSCMTDAKLSRLAHERGICPTVSDSIRIKDSVVVHHRDTVIEVAEKDGPEIDLTLLLKNDSLKGLLDSLIKRPIIEKKNGITVTVKSNGKKLFIDAKEDAYKQKFTDAIYERDVYKSAYERLVKQEKCTLQHHTEWDTFCNHVTVVCLIMLFLAIVYGVYRLQKWIKEKALRL